MTERMMDVLVSDLSIIMDDLPGASAQRAVELLNEAVTSCKYVSDQITKELDFEHTLEIFNQHGALAINPFGAIPVGDRGVLVCNYISTRGSYWNGSLLNRLFIVDEVARWGWVETEVR